MIGQGQVQSLKLDGQPTSLGSKFSAKLDQVAQLISFGALYTFLACLMLEVTFAITNNSGGSITIEFEKLYDILTGVILSFKAADTQLWEFTQSGGQALWQTHYAKFGTYPFVQTDLTIGNTATGTVYLQLPICFWDPRLVEAEDELIWAELLVNSVIEFTWASTGIFGASITYTVSPALSAYAVPRTQMRFPTLVRATEQALTSFAQDQLAVNGLFPMDLVLMPYNTAAGVSMKHFAAADFTSISLTYDGTPIYSQTNPTTMVAFQNLFPKASADRIPQWQAGGNQMLVLASPDMSNGLKSKILYASKQPITRFVGGGGTTVADFRVLERVIIPSGRSTAKSAFAAIGLNAADDELQPKLGVNPTTDPSILQTVPWVYTPKQAKNAA